MTGAAAPRPVGVPAWAPDAPAAGWEEQAACKGMHSLNHREPDPFFPIARADGGPAKQVCQSDCKVRMACLAVALRDEGDLVEYHRAGIWGGLDWQERFMVAREMRNRYRRATRKQEAS